MKPRLNPMQRRFSRAVAVAVFAAVAGTTHAQTIYWTGVTSGTWSDSNNWSSSAAYPGTPTGVVNGSTLSFRQSLTGGTPGNRTMNNDIENLSLASILLNNGNATGYTLNGNKITTSTVTGAGSGSNTIALPLELNANYAFLTGNIVGQGLLTISGVISETGEQSKRHHPERCFSLDRRQHVHRCRSQAGKQQRSDPERR